MRVIEELLILSLATAAISMTVAKAPVFESVRYWFDGRNEWLADLIHCPYCLSHWVAFLAVIVYQPRFVSSGVEIIDWFVSAMAIVAVATAVSGLIYLTVSHISKGGEE